MVSVLTFVEECSLSSDFEELSLCSDFEELSLCSDFEELSLVLTSKNFPFVLISNQDLTAVSGVGLSPRQGLCETSQVLLAGVPGCFLGLSRFCPTY